MVLEDMENDVYRKHQELCTELNLDVHSAEQAWQSYEEIRENYTLEGDQLHWLGCALYVACRKVSTPSVGESEAVVQGNGVNLTRLLRLCNLSLIQFFNKSKEWVNMASMPAEFRNEIQRLERNFEVSTVIFKQYQQVFYEMFINTTEEPTKTHPRSRKQRSVPCSSTKIFEFCWTLFSYVKGVNPEISSDLVTSYHYLLACCDLMFYAAVITDRRDILKPDFKGLPADWSSPDYTTPKEPVCALNALCERFESDVLLDVKEIKHYYFKQHIESLIAKRVLRADIRSFQGLLDQEVFEVNLKSINREYESYVLNKGDFDERIFLDDDANIHIGSPTKFNNNGNITEQLSKRRSDENQPDTPYTNRSYLRGRRDMSAGSTLVTTATSSVSNLRMLLSGRNPNPSAELVAIFENCETNPQEKIETKLTEYGEIFKAKYMTSGSINSSNDNHSIDFASQRLELAKTLYYKLLEDIISNEKQKKPDSNCNHLLNQDIFHHCLFAASLEVVIFSYNSQRKFPWVVDILNLDTYYFWKIIEPIVSIKDHLSRELVKHFNNIEEQILQSMAWRSDSPVWEAISQLSSQRLQVPSCGDVTISKIKTENGAAHQIILTDNGSMSPVNNNFQSPLSSTASERFQSPVPSYLIKKPMESPRIKPGQSLLQNQTGKFYLSISNGEKLIPIAIQSKQTVASDSQPVERKAKRGGSLALFFRKFYNLAYVRIYNLCDKLNLTSTEVRQKIWTCFEYSIINLTELMKDRHLDQILMCAVYAVCKVAKTERTFTEIMKCYRLQPQANSHVYRSVLLRTGSGPPTQPSNNTNVPNVPVTPGQMAGAARNYANEERGDLISFYNTIYIQQIQSFVLKFSTQSDKVPLSPLPTKSLTQSPTRRISDKVYVKSLNKTIKTESPATDPLTYCFSRSPARNLRAINEMINLGTKIGKRRLLTDDNIIDDHVSVTPAKQPSCVVQKKIHGLVNDRLVQSKEKE